MIVLLTIIQYLVQAVVDVMDKFLITKRKIEPVNYTFYTVVMGALLVLVWPWSYFHLPGKFIGLDIFSGAYFALAMYVFFKALSEGEVSRVVPFVFGLVPVFDILISAITGRNVLSTQGIAAICLLLPGAMLVSYHKGKFLIRHVALKIFSAFLFSSYYALWQYSAQVGPTLNNLIWNRIGAAVILLLPLAIPRFRRKIFTVSHVPKKAHTSVLFAIKQILGGANFIFLSFLFVAGNIPIINSLQGFRYAFLFLLGLVLSKGRKKILEERIDREVIVQKFAAILLIFVGTLILFL